MLRNNKPRRLAAGLVALMAAALAVPVTSAPAAAPPEAPPAVQTVRFARGATSATVHGRVTGHGPAGGARFRLTSLAGQSMGLRIREEGARDLTVDVTGPEGEPVSSFARAHWGRTLPSGGEYQVVVRHMTAPAEGGGDAPFSKAFTLEVSVSGRPEPAHSAIDGSYTRGEDGGMEVRALPGGRVHVQMNVAWDSGIPGGVNTGNLGAVLPLRRELFGKGTAVYRAAADDGGGVIEFRFDPQKGTARVVQRGDCGFGLNVVADGSYRRTGRRPPAEDRQKFSRDSL